MRFVDHYENIRQKYNDDPVNTSDKGIAHTYVEAFYDKEFTPKKNDNITLVEIGVWRGKSLELFKEWFINGKIIGVENLDFSHPDHFFNDVFIEMKKKNIEIILGNGYDKKIVDLFEDESIDYLIDDASHDINDQIRCVELYYPKIKKGGKLIIEDISNLDEDLKRFIDLNIKFVVHDMRWNPNKTIAPHLFNNILMIFEK